MRKKSLVITLIMVLVICGLVNSVSALSFSTTMTPSSTTVPEATEFTVTVKVSAIDAGTNGINSLAGYLKYDTDVFETIGETAIEGLNSWQPSYNSENGKITLVKNQFVKTDEEILQITFKTKTGVTGETGAISFSNIVASNSESNISARDISTTITVGTASANANTNTYSNGIQNPAVTINPNRNTNTNVVSPTVNNQNNTNQVPTNTAEEEMPYTGAEDVAMRAIFVVLVVAAVSYFKYESMKDVK